MVLMAVWAVFGAVVGLAAAERQGFSTIAGILGGVLLGPLALLMFAVTGTTRATQRQKCPHCAEFIAVDALVCPHCRRDVYPATIR